MSAVALLTAARARIADPTRWTTGVYACDPTGNRVPAEAPRASRWCAYGAIQAEGGDDHGPAARLLRRAAKDVFGEPVVGINDHRGHAAVLAMYDRAIALAAAEAEGR